MVFRHSWDAFYTKAFHRDRYFFLYTLGTLVMYILLWILLIAGLDTFRPSDTDYITLHYKIIMGTDFIARWETIFLLPAFAAFCIGVNTVLGHRLYHIQKTLMRMLAATSFGVTLVVFAALLLLLRINQ